jgi:hypothetical protein
MSVAVPFLVFVLLTRTAGAQVGTTSGAFTADTASTLCFHPQPRAACRNYTITEFGVGSRAPGEDERHYFWDLGVMRNRSATTAIGASLHFAGGDDFQRYGVKVRYRRWLSESVPLDVAPGVVMHAHEGAHGYRLGVTTQAAVSFHDLAGVFLQLDLVDAGRGTRPQVRFGMRAGTLTGMISGALAPLFILMTSGGADR